MTIMDRYIARKFTFLLALWCLLILLFYMVIDLFSNFDSFVGRTDTVNTIVIILKYYIAHSFPLLNMIAPFLFLIVAITMLKTMDHSNEMIALMANGVSRLRLLLPLFATAFFYSLLFLVIREIVVPRNIEEIIRTPDEYFEKDQSVSVKQMKDYITNIRLAGKSAVRANQEIIDPILTFPNAFSVHGTKLYAQKAIYKLANDKHQTGWLIQKVTKPLEILKKKSVNDYLLTPMDHSDFLAPDECFLVSGLPFDVMMIGDKWVRYASTMDLIRASHNDSLHFSKKELLASIHNRIVRPVIDMLPFFFCLPLIFFRNVNKMSRDIFICIFITFIYIGLQYVSAYFLAEYDPVLAAWIPVLVFIPISFCIFMELIIKPRVLLTNRK